MKFSIYFSRVFIIFLLALDVWPGTRSSESPFRGALGLKAIVQGCSSDSVKVFLSVRNEFVMPIEILANVPFDDFSLIYHYSVRKKSTDTGIGIMRGSSSPLSIRAHYNVPGEVAPARIIVLMEKEMFGFPLSLPLSTKNPSCDRILKSFESNESELEINVLGSIILTTPQSGKKDTVIIEARLQSESAHLIGIRP